MLHLLLTALLFAESATNVDSSPLREAEKASPDDWISRKTHYMESIPETLHELMSDNIAVMEGDMVLPDDRNAVDSIWPTPEIPYKIRPELAGRKDAILSAMAMLSKPTCVSFHKRTSESNYLLFKVSTGCASCVGFVGGEQPVFIGPACTVGNIAHEILHSLGFYHEHTRADREKYITVLPYNIMEGMKKNFEVRRGKTFDLGYDVGSIMHYGSRFFSANGHATILPKSGVKDMGQRVKLTNTDIMKIQLLYSCDVQKKMEKEISGGNKNGDKNVPQLVTPANVTPTITAYSRGQVSANEPEKVPTSTAACPSCSPQHPNLATRGHNNTSRNYY
ncbi:astacin-like metalloendopeptidase isoform X4 [Sander lucioperca]|uniref:astacin-like metalloendopeptidase isoform X4 n=1 Tax=Sander lucioperca TaxID=283035 RepID=UPI00125DD83A|nr:astacin-like metalloendopeptidase isoform X4 [Sander lucioperca]